MGGRGGSSVLGYGAGDTGAVVVFQGQRPLELRLPHRRLDRRKQRQYAAGEPDFDVYAAGGLNAFVCNTTFVGFDQFSWSSA